MDVKLVKMQVLFVGPFSHFISCLIFLKLNRPLPFKYKTLWVGH